METRKIGSLDVSVVGLGCNNFGVRADAERTKEVVTAALDVGITLFDTADVYGDMKSEVFLGQALGPKRDEVVVATKFGARNGGSAEVVRSSCEASLRRLGTDRIDLYQLHTPDPKVPIAETLGALDELVTAGKVIEIGCSNFSGALIDEAAAASAARGWPTFASVQNELSLLQRGGQDDTLAACARHRIGLLPYFPLASGMLTGKVRRDAPPPVGTRLAQGTVGRSSDLLTERSFDVIDALTAFAVERGRTLLELAMSWLACLPNLASVIAGAMSPEQVRSNSAAAGWRLTAEEMDAVDRLAAPR